MNDKQNLPTKGILCSVYVDKNDVSSLCSNMGISSRVKNVVLVGNGIPQIFSPNAETPAVYLKRNICGGEYIHAEPVEQPKGMIGPMAGGAFIYSHDSRFPVRYPISLHDRFDTQKEYDALSI